MEAYPRLARCAEDAGFDAFWVSDDLFLRSVWVILSAVAQQTHAQLFVGVGQVLGGHARVGVELQPRHSQGEGERDQALLSAVVQVAL